MNTKSKKGFTLVEIMIVVVIIGLLAAMAIPAFQKVRENAVGKAMVNDARQLASAAQQYMLENSVTSVTIAYTTTTGKLGGSLAAYVKQIGKGYSAVPASIAQDKTFTMSHPQAAGSVIFTAEGQEQ